MTTLLNQNCACEFCFSRIYKRDTEPKGSDFHTILNARTNKSQKALC